MVPTPAASASPVTRDKCRCLGATVDLLYASNTGSGAQQSVSTSSPGDSDAFENQCSRGHGTASGPPFLTTLVLRRFPLPRKGCTSSSWKPVHFQEPARPSLPAIWRTPPASFPCSVPSKPLHCDWESVVRNCPHLFSVPRLLSAAPRGSSTSFFHNGKMSI